MNTIGRESPTEQIFLHLTSIDSETFQGRLSTRLDIIRKMQVEALFIHCLLCDHVSPNIPWSSFCCCCYLVYNIQGLDESTSEISFYPIIPCSLSFTNKTISLFMQLSLFAVFFILTVSKGIAHIFAALTSPKLNDYSLLTYFSRTICKYHYHFMCHIVS